MPHCLQFIQVTCSVPGDSYLDLASFYFQFPSRYSWNQLVLLFYCHYPNLECHVIVFDWFHHTIILGILSFSIAPFTLLPVFEPKQF